MRTQPVERAIDHAHRDELTAALALLEHFACDRLDRVISTHAPSVADPQARRRTLDGVTL